MKKALLCLTAAILAAGTLTRAFGYRDREFLTEAEIDGIRKNQEIDSRVKFYLAAASLRLASAEARLAGEETLPGDSLEYLTPEDMLDGYHRILTSIMFNLDDASRKIPADRSGIRKALKRLRDKMKEFIPRLQSMAKRAEDKKETGLKRLLEKAVEISDGALEGAEEALSGRFSEY